MSNRFVSGLSKIKDDSGRASASAKLAASQASPEPATLRSPASTLAPSRTGKVVISGYFDPAVRQQLAILAIKQNQSQAAMLAEAMNMLFERYGEAPIARA